MGSDNYHQMSVAELCSILADKTIQLLDASNNLQPEVARELRKEVQDLQAIVKLRLKGQKGEENSSM